MNTKSRQIYKSIAQRQADQTQVYETVMNIYARRGRRDDVREFWQRKRAEQERNKY